MIKEIFAVYPLYALLMFFLIYSVAGWIIEVLRNVSYGKGYVSAGICRGPWCGIYGLGAVAVLLCETLFEGGPLRGFVYGMVIGTFLHLLNMAVIGRLSKGSLKIRFRWFHPLLWGALGTMLICHVNPLLWALLKWLNPWIMMSLLIVFWIIYPGQVFDGLAELDKRSRAKTGTHEKQSE